MKRAILQYLYRISESVRWWLRVVAFNERASATSLYESPKGVAEMEEMLTGAGTLPRRYRGIPVPLWFDMNTSQKLEGMQLLETDVLLDSWPKSGALST